VGVRERRSRQKRYVRQEILDAASELFVREGFENVSMRRSADKIEYSPTPMYLYFKDQAELPEQVCVETFSRLGQRLTKINEQPGKPLEKMRRGLLAYIQFGLENPHRCRATFMMPIPEGMREEKLHQTDSPGMRACDFLRRCVYDGIAAGKLKVKDPELASQTLWAGIHGVTSLLLTHEKFPWVGREKLAKSMVETRIDGLAGARA
jgi:AcrR family transcriptional regulator